jgi:DNA polymerase/3'-5' exonuclease PolX
MVSDIEILYIPKFEEVRDGLFESKKVSVPDAMIDRWVMNDRIRKRPNIHGSFTWGGKNKLAIDVATGIPIDFFAVLDLACWWNSLVCRTGGKNSNLLVTTTAQRLGWSFEAYGSGFHKLNSSEHYQTKSERDVFDFLGLKYREPWERHDKKLAFAWNTPYNGDRLSRQKPFEIACPQITRASIRRQRPGSRR